MNVMNSFLDLLEGETDLYRALREVLQKEKDAVVSSRIEDLNEAGKEKENLLLKIRILEEQRMHLTDKLATLFGCSVNDLNLSKLSKLVEKPYSTRLDACHSSLADLMQGIKKLNNSNKALLVHSLDLVKGSLTLFNSLVASNPVYYCTGKIQGPDYSGKVLSGEI